MTHAEYIIHQADRHYDETEPCPSCGREECNCDEMYETFIDNPPARSETLARKMAAPVGGKERG